MQKRKFKLLSLKRYFRYIKIYLNQKVFILIIIISIISNTIVNFQEKKYLNLYKENENLSFIAIVVGNREEKEYKDTYKIKVVNMLNKKDNKNYKDTFLILSIDKKSKILLGYGDKIKVEGEYVKPEKARNYGGFDYSNYLKTLKIYGTIKTSKVKTLEKECLKNVFMLANRVNVKIKENIKKLMDDKYASILIGLILGDTSNIEEELKEKFKIANISHILAISGMHITYIIIGINLILKNFLGKKKTRIITIAILVIYVFITGFSPSIVRASIMGIMVLISKLIHKRNDTWTAISLSLLVLLIYNPYLLGNIGLQLSYLGTIGIIVFNKNIYKFLHEIKLKNDKVKYKINRKLILTIDRIKEILAITFSAQVMIMPVMLFHFNILGSYFFISNFLVSIIIGPIIIIGSIGVITSFFSMEISRFILFIVLIGIKFLINISEIANLPFSKIYLSTPKIWQIIIYYIIVIILNKIYSAYFNKKINNTERRIKNLVALAKYEFYKNKKQILAKIIIIIFFIFTINLIPKELKIHFIDVGQGDSTFIITPKNKTILIDGGGSESKEFDVGKSTLLPYLLDKGYTKIDYIFISHFDQDHVGGIITILKELNVGQLFITKQEESLKYEEVIKLAKSKKIKINIVKSKSKIQIEKDLYINVLWPGGKYIEENSINNNSMVAKLCYKDFSMMFTGDIEEMAEKEILKEYKDSNILSSTVLKVAHHGSKTSSSKEFLEKVSPKFALIGVGKNNLFGHPSNEVLNNLEDIKCKYYRTDEKGEIILRVKGENILINGFIE